MLNLYSATLPTPLINSRNYFLIPWHCLRIQSCYLNRYRYIFPFPSCKPFLSFPLPSFLPFLFKEDRMVSLSHIPSLYPISWTDVLIGRCRFDPNVILRVLFTLHMHCFKCSMLSWAAFPLPPAPHMELGTSPCLLQVTFLPRLLSARGQPGSHTLSSCESMVASISS